jgi:hypothetical protein
MFTDRDLPLIAVNSEKFMQWVHALLVMEELCRKVAVRNSMPFPMDFERVGWGKDAVKGSKSNSSTKFPLVLHKDE